MPRSPLLRRRLDDIMSAWSTAVLSAALATALLLPLAGVPLLGPAGSLYRAMGVLTAGSPCALVLCPLAYVCAVAAVSRTGVLLKSAGVLDALAQGKGVIPPFGMRKSGQEGGDSRTDTLLKPAGVVDMPVGRDGSEARSPRSPLRCQAH
eukprot:356647-Chlamydomonas_euryale.AAC.11